MSYDAVFVDLDDTLYPYPPCNEAGKQAAWVSARDLDYDLSRDEFDDLYMDARRDVKREVAGTAAEHERYLYLKRLVELADQPYRSADALALGDAYWNAYLDEMTLFDGVTDALQELRANGIDVAIVTNLTTRIQLQKLQHLGLDDHVDLLLTSEETGREKPSTIMFTQPLTRLDHKPSTVLVVGDSIENDVVGGNAAGMTTVLCNNDTTDLTGDRQPDHHIDTFADVTEVAF